MAKYIVVIALHVFMQPAVKNTIQSMIYLYTHAHRFEQTFIPFLTQLMKLFVIISVEIVNLWSVSVFDSELWIVMCFNALWSVQMLDAQLFSFCQSKFKDRLTNKLEFKLPIEDQHLEFGTKSQHNDGLRKKEMKLSNRQKTCKCIAISLKLLYEVVYFYFFPFILLMFLSNIE